MEVCQGGQTSTSLVLYALRRSHSRSGPRHAAPSTLEPNSSTISKLDSRRRRVPRKLALAARRSNVRFGSMLSKKDFACTSEQDRFKISLGYATSIQRSTHMILLLRIFVRQFLRGDFFDR